MKNILVVITCFLLCAFQRGEAQSFNGVRGSIYNPVINLSQQPASGANMPNKWGVEIIGVNSFWSNNIVSLSPAKFEWTRDSTHFRSFVIEGSGKHDLFLKTDIHILNFLLKIPKHEDWTVGAGWNIRTHSFLAPLSYRYNDSMYRVRQFLEANALDKNMQSTFVNTQWSEWFVNVSKILENDASHSMTAGASLKFIKGMGAEIVDLYHFGVNQVKPSVSDPDELPLASVQGQYGYSSNLEDLEKANGIKGQREALMKGNPMSIGLDIGWIYTKKEPIYIPGFKKGDRSDYDWKLSLAITDFGRLKYDLGKESRSISGVKQLKDVETIRRMVKEASSLSKINDTLRHILGMSPWSGYVTVSLPTRLHVNFDKNMGHHFYVNVDANLNVSFLNPEVDYFNKSLSYMTITPRWEKKRWGFSLPFYVNEKGRFLAGAVLRVGPLVAGVHDFAWLFHHSPNGGAYLGVVIKGLKKEKSDCPDF